jgi:DNA-binding transcriptional LysR family regulator
MDRDLLGHLPIIVCVARHRSFAAAATELRMSPSAISHAVRSVEDRLGIPLFARTTRSVSLTEAGARFVGGVEPALTNIGRAFGGLTAERGEVTGLLRIATPRVVLEMALARILAKLAREHPRLTVEARTGQPSQTQPMLTARVDTPVDLGSCKTDHRYRVNGHHGRSSRWPRGPEPNIAHSYARAQKKASTCVVRATFKPPRER